MNTKTALFKQTLFNVLIIIVDTDVTFSDMIHTNEFITPANPLSTVESEFISYNNCCSNTQAEEHNKPNSIDLVT